MTTKDYVYLGLILLAALAFYCNGFYAGVYRCKRMYDTAVEDAEVDSDATAQLPESGKLVSNGGKSLAASALPRKHDILVPDRELRGNFSNN